MSFRSVFAKCVVVSLVLPAAQSNQPPRFPFDATPYSKASLHSAPLTLVRLGNHDIHLGVDGLRQVVKVIGIGDIAYGNDGVSVCYRPKQPNGDRYTLWFLSDEEFGGPELVIHGIFASINDLAGCPSLPVAFSTVSSDAKVWVRSTSNQLRQLGSPTVVKDGWTIFASERVTPQGIENGELLLRLRRGTVVDMWATLQMDSGQ